MRGIPGANEDQPIDFGAATCLTSSAHPGRLAALVLRMRHSRRGFQASHSVTTRSITRSSITVSLASIASVHRRQADVAGAESLRRGRAGPRTLFDAPA